MSMSVWADPPTDHPAAAAAFLSGARSGRPLLPSDCELPIQSLSLEEEEEEEEEEDGRRLRSGWLPLWGRHRGNGPGRTEKPPRRGPAASSASSSASSSSCSSSCSSCWTAAAGRPSERGGDDDDEDDEAADPAPPPRPPAAAAALRWSLDSDLVLVLVLLPPRTAGEVNTP